MEAVKTKDLVIGKRYYLDTTKGVSGVYIGEYSEHWGPERGLYFDSIEGNLKKYARVDGVVGFSYDNEFEAYELRHH